MKLQEVTGSWRKLEQVRDLVQIGRIWTKLDEVGRSWKKLAEVGRSWN